MVKSANMPDIIDINTLFGPWPAAATDLGVDELLEMMKRHGTQSACTLSTVGLLLDHNTGNAATRAACAQHTELIPAATINPQAFYGGDGPHAHLKSEGFKLIRLFPCIQGWEPDYAAFTALVKAISVDPVPIMVDVEGPGVATRMVTAMAGHPVSIILAGVNEASLAEAICLKRAHANVYVETSGLLAAGALKFVVDSVGPERVLFGSGAPARPMAGVLSVLKHSALTDAAQAAVLSSNASRLLGL
jgi:predicted TIM-barrel fold metal-dependent hydrolase